MKKSKQKYIKKNKTTTKDKRSTTQNRLSRSHYHWSDNLRLKVPIYTCIYYLKAYKLSELLFFLY